MIKQSKDEPTTSEASSDFSESAVPLMTQEKESFPTLSPSKRSTKERMNRLSFRVNMTRAKCCLEASDWDAAINLYSELLVCAGHEQDPAINAEEDIAKLSSAALPYSDVSSEAIAQILLGRSTAWFGCENYWRSYEDASSALALVPQNLNRWALLRIGHCLQRMHFYPVAIDVFRRGHEAYPGDKRMREGFIQCLKGLRINWHQYLPSPDSMHGSSRSEPLSSFRDNSTSYVPAPLTPLPHNETLDEKTMADIQQARTNGDIATATSIEEKALIHLEERRLLTLLRSFGMLNETHDLIDKESHWWSTVGLVFREEAAASRDVIQAYERVSKVLLRYKVSLIAVFLYFVSSDENIPQQNWPEISKASKDTIRSQCANSSLAQESAPLSGQKRTSPTKMHGTPTSPAATSIRHKRFMSTARHLIKQKVKVPHGLSLIMDINKLTRFAHESGFIRNASDLTFFRTILDRFRSEQQQQKKMSTINEKNGGKNGSGYHEISWTQPKESTDAVIGTKNKKISTQPLLLSFPKFCEVVVRLVLAQNPVGTNKEAEASSPVEEGEKRYSTDRRDTKPVSGKERRSSFSAGPRPPNMPERLSRGLDAMLEMIGPKLRGSTLTSYRWISVKERFKCQRAIKPFIVQLRGIFLNIRRESSLLQNIGIIDFLRFMKRYDLVDVQNFTVQHAAHCFIAIVYFTGDYSCDLADFDSFVEILVCCVDVRSESGMVPLEDRVVHFLQGLCSKCL